MKTPIIILHGGSSYRRKEAFYNELKESHYDPNKKPPMTPWHVWLQEILGVEQMVHKPQMPNSLNADYGAWRTWFDKVVEFCGPAVILVGH